MIGKIVLTLCVLLVVGTIYCDAQRDGRRRSGRRKPTTESPPVEEEPIKEKKNEAEPEAISSTQASESQTPAPNKETPDKETANSNHGGPPFIVPRGTRKPRPHVRNSGEARPRPTLPTFARKRGPKSNQQELKKNEDNVVSTTTSKPSRISSRNHGNTSQKEDKNLNAEKTSEATDEVTTETAPKRRFGGGSRRQSRGNRRQNVES